MRTAGQRLITSLPGQFRIRSGIAEGMRRRTEKLLWIALGVVLLVCGCGGGVTSSSSPPATVSVTVSPASANVFLGSTQQFTATVSNTSNTAVTWQVNGIAGGNAAVGTISPGGLYTAPKVLPAAANVTVTAVSQADPSKTASASVTVQSDVAVSVSPTSASVELGAVAQFSAVVNGSGDPDRSVKWSVNGTEGGNTEAGTISAAGEYTAPRILPAGEVRVTATSVADPAKNATASVTITSHLTIAITSGPATVQNGTTAQFTAAITPAANSNPDPRVTWSVNGIAGGNATVGTIDASGLYTAPVVAPDPPQVTITATSVADPSKSASVNVTIESAVTVFISPTSASVELEKTIQFSATVGGTTNQRVFWSVNGITGGDQTVGTITNTVDNPGLYTAPKTLPSPNQVTVRATSEFDPTKFAEATVTLFSSITITVSPGSSTRAVNRKQSFTAQVSNTTNTAVEWRVNGVPGGNSSVGQICIAGLSGCFPTTSGTTVAYLAPASVPVPNQVTVEAVSQADPTRKGSALVTILANLVVQVSPASANVPTGGTQQFTASVLGTDDQRVTWSVAGTSCSGGPCGSITASGLYSAPVSVAGAATDTVIATSVEDPTRSASASVAIGTGPFIRMLEPSSLTAGLATGVTLRVIGSNFVAGNPGSGSTILLNGADKPTTCTAADSGFACTTSIDPAEVASAGEKPVRIRNPDSSVSNQVVLIVVEPPADEDVIPLDSTAPRVAGKDIAVVDASTLGTAAPQVNLEAIGLVVNGNCTLSSSPLRITRPASGVQQVDICLLGTNITTAHSYSISGPSPNDISVGPAAAPGGFVQVTLTLSSTTRPGLRTLFVETANKDRSAASGAIEVK